jgi:hypothetical protein
MAGSLAAAGAAAAPANAIAAPATDEAERAEWLALWRAVVDAEARHDAEADDGNEHELYLAMSDARDVIVEKPATSLVGIAVKLACALRFTNMPALDTDLDDFQNVELVAIYRDAVRLAGLPEGLWSGGQP